MDIKEININKNNYKFINEYWERWNAWGHSTSLLINNREVKNARIRYYNRTWECYTYQTAMYKALNDYIDELQESFLNNYKYQNNICRFHKGEKEKVIDLFKKSETYKDLQKLKKSIDMRKFKGTYPLMSY